MYLLKLRMKGNNKMICLKRPYISQQERASIHTSRLPQGWPFEALSMFWNKHI